MKILVVDDEAPIFSVCQRILEGEGHQVVTTANPLALLEPHDCLAPGAPCAGFDAILTDNNLGLAKTGMDFLSELRQSTCRLHSGRFVLMSAKMPENSGYFAARFNVQLLGKPFQSGSLRSLFAPSTPII